MKKASEPVTDLEWRFGRLVMIELPRTIATAIYHGMPRDAALKMAEDLIGVTCKHLQRQLGRPVHFPTGEEDMRFVLDRAGRRCVIERLKESLGRPA